MPATPPAIPSSDATSPETAKSSARQTRHSSPATRHCILLEAPRHSAPQQSDCATHKPASPPLPHRTAHVDNRPRANAGSRTSRRRCVSSTRSWPPPTDQACPSATRYRACRAFSCASKQQSTAVPTVRARASRRAPTPPVSCSSPARGRGASPIAGRRLAAATATIAASLPYREGPSSPAHPPRCPIRRAHDSRSAHFRKAPRPCARRTKSGPQVSSATKNFQQQAVRYPGSGRTCSHRRLRG